MPLIRAFALVSRAYSLEDTVRALTVAAEQLLGPCKPTFYLLDVNADTLVAQNPSLPLKERVIPRGGDPALWRAIQGLVRSGLRTCVPVRTPSRELGILVVSDPVEDPEQLELLSALADIAAGNLERLHLRQTADRHAAILETLCSITDEGVVVASASSSELVVVNRRLEEMSGWTGEELRSKGWFECLYPDPEARARAVVSVRAAFHGAPAEGVPWRLTHKNGHPVECILRSRAIALDGQPAFIVGLFRDVRSEREHREEVATTQRYEQLGRLASAVAHDFNNLVAAVQGHAELLAARYDGEVAERARIILGTVTRATTLTQQLVTFGKDQPVWLVPTDLEGVCRDVVNTFSEKLPSLDIKVEPSTSLPPVDLDARAFSQALLNLLHNARDATGPRGHIRVQVERAEPPSRPLKRWDSPARIGWVRVRVTDDGPGVPSHLRSHLFEPFFSTKPAGHGLGLASVARIAEGHGAVLDAPQHGGRGAIFDVYLPIAGRPLAAPAMRKDPDAGGTERIWVVDDDEAVRDYLVAALGAFGYAVRGFGSPAELLKAVEAGEVYDLLVSDLSMPEMDGMDLHFALRARGIRRPVLFCSGYSDRAATIPTGRDVDFMQKPLSMRALAQRVRRLLNYTLPDVVEAS